MVSVARPLPGKRASLYYPVPMPSLASWKNISAVMIINPSFRTMARSKIWLGSALTVATYSFIRKAASSAPAVGILSARNRNTPNIKVFENIIGNLTIGMKKAFKKGDIVKLYKEMYQVADKLSAAEA